MDLKPKETVTDTNADTTLQPEQNTVQSQQLAPEPQPQRDEKADLLGKTKIRGLADGTEGNPEMTAFALGLHTIS